VFHIKAVGIIAEYNPFHNGHLWHAHQAKQQSGNDYCIAVLSGQFTQRGEPAAFDKWTRAAMAVMGGVDLVLELPAVFSVRSAQYFATAGVQLLNTLGVVTHLAFGAETPDRTLLQQAADLNTIELGPALRERLTAGVTYAAALADCLSLSGASVSILSQPNNILAIEYLRAISRLAQSLTPVIIPRRYSHYHDTEITSPFASASAVRQALRNGDDDALHCALPPASLALINQRLLEGRGPVSYEAFTTPILYKLRTAQLSDLAELPDIAEGLHHKLAVEALRSTTIEELLSRVKSKRYTRTRLQRILIQALLGLSRQQIEKFDQYGPLYARVLAFNANGRLLLKAVAKDASIPIITKTAHFLNTKQRSRRSQHSLAAQMLSIDTLASDIYSLGAPNIQQRAGASDFHQSPFYIDRQSP
jgi:predicted nucleotidyltransferase